MRKMPKQEHWAQAAAMDVANLIAAGGIALYGITMLAYGAAEMKRQYDDFYSRNPRVVSSGPTSGAVVAEAVRTKVRMPDGKIHANEISAKDFDESQLKELIAKQKPWMTRQ